MHNLSQRYGKLLSVGLSVICSVFLVAVVVSAATTIGVNISTGGTLTVTGNATVGGLSTSTLDNMVIGGSTKAAGSFTTLTSTGLYTPTGGISTSTWDSVSLGLVTPGKVSSTLLSVMNTLYVGGTATTTINSAGNLSVAGTASVTGLFTPTGGISTSTWDNVVIGGSTATAGKFTAVTSTVGFFGANEATSGTLTVAGTSAWLTIGNGSASTTIGGYSTTATSTNPYGTVLATTGGNVGIGTASPAFLLDVNGSLRTSGVFTPTGGISTSTLDNVVIGGSTKAAGSFTTVNASTAVKPTANSTVDLGSSSSTSLAFRSIYASSSLVVGGQAATTTINFGSAPNGTTGKGTCIVLSGSDGTLYFVSVSSTVATAPNYLVFSTVDCR